MTNVNNPTGGKAVGSFNAAKFNLKVNKYITSVSDTTALYVNDAVKTTGTAAVDGTPVVTKAAAGDTLRGFVVAIKPTHDDENAVYRKASTERIVYVCDDPYIMLEIQTNGTLAVTDIGKYANIVVNGGNNITGLSATLVDLSSTSTDSRQLRIVSLVDRVDNEVGQYGKVLCVIHDHELAHGATGSQENLWKRVGTVLSPFNTGDDVDLGTGDLTANQLNSDTDIKLGLGVADTVLNIIFDGLTNDGNIAYDPSTDNFDLTCTLSLNGTHAVGEISTSVTALSTDAQLPTALAVWNAISVEDLWNRAGTTLKPSTANDDVLITKSTSTASDYTLKTDTTLTADVDGVIGHISEMTAYTSGMTGGKEIVAYEAILNRSASDTNGQYIGFRAADFTTPFPSNESPSYGFWCGKEYSWGLYLESGRILINDDHADIISCARETDGDGPSLTISASDGRSSGAPQDGGDFILEGGFAENGGTPGEIIFHVQTTDVAKFNSDGNFELTSGTDINEIVTSISGASTDDQAATAKSIYDAIMELSRTQHEVFVATAAQVSFTILGPTPLNPTTSHITVQGVTYQYGAGNDFTISGNTITWYNNNYTMQLNDDVQIWYDGPGSETRNWDSYSGTLPAAGATLVVTAAQLGITDARQITDATLWGRGTDQNWYKAMNTWGGATHEFNFTIPTLADPNLGDLVIQVAGTASSVASQPFKISFEYTSTNFLT